MRGSVSRIYFFLLQFGLISGRCGRSNRRKTMRIWWNMPQFWDSQAFWLKRNIPVQKWHFQNCACFFLFFRDMFFFDLSGGLDAPLPYPVFVNLARCCCTSLWHLRVSGVRKVPERQFAAGKCIFIPQLYTDLYLWRDVRNHPKLVFHSILSHLVNLVKVSDSGRIHSSLQKTKHQAWKGLLSKDWNAQIRGPEETFTSSSSTEFVL